MFKRYKARKLEKEVVREIKREELKDELLKVDSNYEQCLKVLAKYNLNQADRDVVIEQIKAVVAELEAIEQVINHQEIVTEVIEQNDINVTELIGREEKINLKYAARHYKFTTETIRTLEINGKYSGVTIDLREFTFPCGELTIITKGKYSGVDIYINDDVNVGDWTNLKMAGVSYSYQNDQQNYESFHQLPEVTKYHSLRLEGDMSLSGIQVRVAYSGEPIHHHGNSKRKNKRLKRAERRMEKRS